MTGPAAFTVEVPRLPDLALDGEWDTEKVREFADGLVDVATRLVEAGSAGTRPAAADWVGDDADRYHGEVRGLAERTDPAAEALRSVSLEVDAHAEALDGLQWRRDELRHRRTTLAGEIDELRMAVAASGPQEQAWLERWSQSLAGRAQVLDQDGATWREDLSDAESSMLRAFASLRTLEQVRRHVAGQPDLAADALARLEADGTAEANQAWWLALTPAEQRAVIATAPEVIGNLDGLPASVRHEANESRLDADIDRWQHRLDEGITDPDVRDDVEERLANALAARDALDDLAGRVDPVTGEPVVAQLYTYDPTAFGGDGAVAISIGDLDSADNVAVAVPGLTSTMESIGEHSGAAANLYDASRSMHPDESTAVLAWIDYDAPSGNPLTSDSASVVREDLAREGGARLADTLDGLRASRPDDPANLTAIGHSYGAATLAHTLSSHDVDVDAAVVIGAPGMGPAETVDDLDVPDGRFYVGRNSEDFVADLGDKGWVDKGDVGGLGLGRDPAEDDFGGTRFQAEDPGSGLIEMHTNYYDPNTESLWNMGQIVTGHHDDLMLADPVTDPWYRGSVDPEEDATIEQPRTDEQVR